MANLEETLGENVGGKLANTNKNYIESTAKGLLYSGLAGLSSIITITSLLQGDHSSAEIAGFVTGLWIFYAARELSLIKHYIEKF